MSTNSIRVATAALSERIYAGRPTKDGKGLKEPRYDVTSDVLLAIRDKVGIGCEIAVGPVGGDTEFRIAVLPPRDSDRSGEAGETGTGSTEGESAGLEEASPTPTPGNQEHA